MAEITLNATIRDYTGRSKSNAARRDGKVPGVFYLGSDKNITIEVEALDLRALVYTSETTIIDLQFSDGTSEAAVLREVQFDPITDRIMHIDLIGVVRGQLMKFEVPITLEGQSEGVRGGGVLTQTLHKVEVECLPKDLPQHIVLDVTHLLAGESLSVADIDVEGLVIITSPDVNVAVVAHSRTDADETEEGVEGVEGSEEPEVIPHGKDEEA
ncbi:MAG: 50S ribosomal protein L25 [Bacteroidetes bacterium]|nr:50S ribosomal protein L25 [Bacteroidota bacterium]